MATMAAAAKAFCMKSYSSIVMMRSFVIVRTLGTMVVAVRVAFHIVSAGHDEDSVLQTDYLDLGPVERRQHRTRDHLVDGAERRAPPPEIKHAVERAEQRIELVRAEQEGDPEFGLERFHQ